MTDNNTEFAELDSVLPLVPLRDVVVYPHMVIPLFVGRDKSIAALEAARGNDREVLLVAQKSSEVDEPVAGDLYSIGTLARVLQLLKLPDGTIKVLVEGVERANIGDIEFDGDYLRAEYDVLEDQVQPLDDNELSALIRSTNTRFEDFVKSSKKIASEVVNSVAGVEEPGRLADIIAAHLTVSLDKRQRILEQQLVTERLQAVLALIESELDVAQVEKRLRGRVRSQMEKNQREYYLNEQMKAIQKELGESEDAPNELEELTEKISKAGMPKDVRKKADAELNKLKMMPAMSAEATVSRNYLDWLLGVPWKKRSKIKQDLAAAEAILDADHYGLEKVKERILEYLAVQQRVKKMAGPILCLVGPPGVGKTSLGKSIARATNRDFARISLGGVRDEAEIRGHRRTYIGSMPGKIVQSMNKVGKKNPLFLLDEIDKMSNDFRGDPSSALLEVLDPEQNSAFNDHYLEVDCDLSEVMFVCTANTLNIPGPLLDRMEVIRLSGYTEDEKLHIARQYLLPKQQQRNGLKEAEISVSDAAIRDVIRHYTREAGVRNLERELSKICRKAVRKLIGRPKGSQIAVEPDQLDEFLGVLKYRFGRAEKEDRVGQVTGLAWTEVGGELLTIESAATTGKGKLTHTGSLGDVMKESVQAALTVVRSRAESLGIDADFLSKLDLHIHVPEGATPKDGPSAGGAMVTALASVLTGIPVRADVAMTGEITLRGEVLPIGGLKEKLLAAQRGGIAKVLIPEENKKDLAEIPDNIKAQLDIQPVRWIDQVFEHALQSLPQHGEAVPAVSAQTAIQRNTAAEVVSKPSKPH